MITPIADHFKAGLAPNPSGGVIQNTGCGEDSGLLVRNGAVDGAINNTEAVSSIQNGTGRLLNGIINIRAAKIITFLGTFTIGSLTTADIIPEFSPNFSDWFKLSLLTNTAGIITLQTNPLTLRLAATGNFLFSIPNPGCPWMRIKTASNGTATNSNLLLYILRGWASPLSIGLGL